MRKLTATGTRGLIIGLLAALVAGTGFICDPSVGDPGGFQPPPEAKDTRPTCPEIEFRADEERCFTIETFIESRIGPYDVYINITGGNGAYPPHMPISSGRWKHGVVYRTGEKLEITVTLTVERPGSNEGYCSITDGSQSIDGKLKSGKANGGAPYNAICKLTTSQ